MGTWWWRQVDLTRFLPSRGTAVTGGETPSQQTSLPRVGDKGTLACAHTKNLLIGIVDLRELDFSDGGRRKEALAVSQEQGADAPPTNAPPTNAQGCVFVKVFNQSCLRV